MFLMFLIYIYLYVYIHLFWIIMNYFFCFFNINCFQNLQWINKAFLCLSLSGCIFWWWNNWRWHLKQKQLFQHVMWYFPFFCFEPKILTCLFFLYGHLSVYINVNNVQIFRIIDFYLCFMDLFLYLYFDKFFIYMLHVK